MLHRFRFQAGVALPVMLIMLVVMMISGIYLLRSSTSTTMSTSNLAYESALSKAADRGINEGFIWLTTRSRDMLFNDDSSGGYVANLNVGANQGVSNPAFWAGSTKIDDGAGNKIEYVIHRLCPLKGAPGPNNVCAMDPSIKKSSSEMAPGDSAIIPAVPYRSSASLHYLVTARIFGERGGNVINQAEVLMGQ